MASVLFVCLGNICRSPMAEAVAAAIFEAAGRSDIVVDSAGTSAWHVGEAPDPRTLAVLARHGQSRPSMVARQYTPEDARRFDLVLVMDAANLRDVRASWPADATAVLARVLDATDGGDVPDPYGSRDGSAFEAVHRMLTDAMEAWLRHPRLTSG